MGKSFSFSYKSNGKGGRKKWTLDKVEELLRLACIEEDTTDDELCDYIASVTGNRPKNDNPDNVVRDKMYRYNKKAKAGDAEVIAMFEGLGFKSEEVEESA